MLTNNPDDYEFGYTWSPGRLERRRHCFALCGLQDAVASHILFSGYGDTPRAAFSDLRDEIQRSDFSAIELLLPKLFYDWTLTQQGRMCGAAWGSFLVPRKWLEQ